MQSDEETLERRSLMFQICIGWKLHGTALPELLITEVYAAIRMRGGWLCAYDVYEAILRNGGYVTCFLM
jgi:hypothetical protein